MKRLLAGAILLAILTVACVSTSSVVANTPQTATGTPQEGKKPILAQITPTVMVITVTGCWNVREGASANTKAEELPICDETILARGIRDDGWIYISPGRFICGRAAGYDVTC